MLWMRLISTFGLIKIMELDYVSVIGCHVTRLLFSKIIKCSFNALSMND